MWESQLPGLVIFGWRYPTLQCCTGGCLGSHYGIADRNTEHSSLHFRVACSIGQPALRQADGRLVTARETAVTACIKKGLDAGDGELMADFTKRIAWTLAWMLGRGVVTKRGYGASAPWGTAQSS